METTIKAFTATRVNNELAVVKVVVADELAYTASNGTESTTNKCSVGEDVCNEHIGCGLNVFGEGAFADARALAVDLTKEFSGTKVEVENLELATDSGLIVHRWTIVKMA